MKKLSILSNIFPSGTQWVIFGNVFFRLSKKILLTLVVWSTETLDEKKWRQNENERWIVQGDQMSL
jgi:hypothetical protein